MAKNKKTDLRICSFGREFEEARIPRLPFVSHRSLLDFDVVICELHGLQEEWNDRDGYNFRYTRKNQIEEFLELGRTVIALLDHFDGLSTLFPVGDTETIPLVGRSIVFNGPGEMKLFWDSVKNCVS